MGELNPQKETNLRGDTRLFTKQEKNIEMREDYVFLYKTYTQTPRQPDTYSETLFLKNTMIISRGWDYR